MDKGEGANQGALIRNRDVCNGNSETSGKRLQAHVQARVCGQSQGKPTVRPVPRPGDVNCQPGFPCFFVCVLPQPTIPMQIHLLL